MTLEVWKCGNMSSLSLSNDSGSVEMWKYVFIVLIYRLTLEVWKCGNVSPLSLSINTGSVEMWRNVSSLSLSNNSGSVEIWKCVWDDLAIKNRTGARRNDALLPFVSIARQLHG